MDPKAALKLAWMHGHFWKDNPDVTLSEALLLDVNHPIARQAWESWREADGNYAILLASTHGRFQALDDRWGPATETLVSLPRCPVPDHPPPKEVQFAGLEAWEVELFESIRRWESESAATGSGSWPHPGCTPGSEDVHSIRINIDTSNAASHWKEDWPEVARLVAIGYADMGLRITYVMDGDARRSEIEKKFERIPGGVIGWNHFPRPNDCQQTISGRLDNDYRADVQMKAMLEKHETGHGVGLRHIAGSNSTMNPSILRLRPDTWRGDPHERTLIRYFGGETIPVDPEQPTPPPDDPTMPLPGGRPVIDYKPDGLYLNGFPFLLTPRLGV